MRRLLLTFCVCLMASIGSEVTAQTLHKTSKHWRVFSITKDGEKLCYMASTPTKKTGNYRRRGGPFVIVTHVDANKDEVSVSSGYPYNRHKKVQMIIDGKTYELFSKGERAWAENAKTDTTLVKRMKKGARLTVRGESQLKTFSMDTYSLSGFTAAHKSMKALCR